MTGSNGEPGNDGARPTRVLPVDWQYYSLDQAPFKAQGIRNWLFEGLRVHGTGSSAFKLTMRADNVTIRCVEQEV